METLTGKQREALRSLLGAIVLADGRVRESEVNEYARRICDLTQNMTTPDEEARWLLARSDDIRTHMNSPAGRFWLSEQIETLRGSGTLSEFLDAIWSVAVSDSDLHPKEADILDFAFDLWKRQVPD